MSTSQLEGELKIMCISWDQNGLNICRRSTNPYIRQGFFSNLFRDSNCSSLGHGIFLSSLYRIMSEDKPDIIHVTIQNDPDTGSILRSDDFLSLIGTGYVKLKSVYSQYVGNRRSSDGLQLGISSVIYVSRFSKLIYDQGDQILAQALRRPENLNLFGITDLEYNNAQYKFVKNIDQHVYGGIATYVYHPTLNHPLLFLSYHFPETKNAANKYANMGQYYGATAELNYKFSVISESIDRYVTKVEPIIKLHGVILNGTFNSKLFESGDKRMHNLANLDYIFNNNNDFFKILTGDQFFRYLNQFPFSGTKYLQNMKEGRISTNNKDISTGPSFPVTFAYSTSYDANQREAFLVRNNNKWIYNQNVKNRYDSGFLPKYSTRVFYTKSIKYNNDKGLFYCDKYESIYSPETALSRNSPIVCTLIMGKKGQKNQQQGGGGDGSNKQNKQQNKANGVNAVYSNDTVADNTGGGKQKNKGGGGGGNPNPNPNKGGRIDPRGKGRGYSNQPTGKGGALINMSGI